MSDSNAFPMYLLNYTKNDYLRAFRNKYGEEILTDDLRYAIGFNAYGAVNMALEYISLGMKEDQAVMGRRTYENMPAILKKYFI